MNFIVLLLVVAGLMAMIALGRWEDLRGRPHFKKFQTMTFPMAAPGPEPMVWEVAVVFPNAAVSPISTNAAPEIPSRPLAYWLRRLRLAELPKAQGQRFKVGQKVLYFPRHGNGSVVRIARVVERLPDGYLLRQPWSPRGLAFRKHEDDVRMRA